MSSRERSGLTVYINSEIASKFKIWCVTHNIYQNKAIEILVKEFLEKGEKEKQDIIKNV